MMEAKMMIAGSFDEFVEKITQAERKALNTHGVHIDWLHMNVRSQSEAVRKARATAARGCYKDQLDTITATESGIEYTYKAI